MPASTTPVQRRVRLQTRLHRHHRPRAGRILPEEKVWQRREADEIPATGQLYPARLQRRNIRVESEEGIVLRSAEAIVKVNHLIRLMSSIGDTFYQRAIVREILKTTENLWIINDWPQFWRDLPVRILPSETNLRAQSENRSRSRFDAPPDGPTRIRSTTYTPTLLQQNPNATIIDILADRLSESLPEKLDMSFIVPDEWRWTPTTDRPIAVVRPPTVRRELPARGRNPDPAAFAACVNHLMQTHHVVSVANSDPICEPMVDPIEAHERYEVGQLTIEQVIGLMASSDIALSGVGMALPICGAIGARCFIVHGGCLGCNSPGVTMDARCDWSSIGYVMPDQQCWCYERNHDCRKSLDPSRAVSELDAFIKTTKPKRLAA